MKFFGFFILLFLALNSFIFSSSFNYAKTGELWTFACVEFCPYPVVDESSYPRGIGVCL